MSSFRQGRYSWLIKPIFYTIDITAINLLAALFFFDQAFSLRFSLIISFGWIVTALISKFYEVPRYSSIVRVLNLLVRQALFFSLLVFAYEGAFPQPNVDPNQTIKYIILCFIIISFFKYLLFFLLKSYRAYLKGNIRRTIILGNSKEAKDLELFFKNNPESGFINTKIVSFKKTENIDLNALFNYIKDERVDEIYCSLSEIESADVKAITKFADNNLKVVKFIPEQNTVLNQDLKRDFYGVVPVLEFRNIPLDDYFNLVLKRMFDIGFSLLVIVLILSWLTPLLALLIKIESKGPVFFTQLRNGYNYKSFNCFKFRSMVINDKANLIQVSKADQRITKIGKIMRQTSMDELPQFLNVLKGDMSVVGPRPHMLSHTEMYAGKVDKFMVRHFIKPGITGLAQVSGYRGEVETDKDIIGRVKYDIFYIENWSIFLDLKIIIQTIIKAIKGDEKAY
ncbi:exopolysaccharide biosynthesis polyprenyl glycosylphosphotransferase [Flavobacteriaceae bacterium]|nr:exopolysaccharide biosynthesis polyprenyl glycosylphosphotransferase [Flavobacteriaceae bacterium]